MDVNATTGSASELVAAAHRARAVASCARRDLRDAVHRLVDVGMTESDISRVLGVKRLAVWKLLVRAPQIVPDGFADATAYGICERYSAGYIDGDELARQLSRWEFAPMQWAGSLVEDVGPVEGTFSSEVGQALRDGLIDGELYELVLNAQQP